MVPCLRSNTELLLERKNAADQDLHKPSILHRFEGLVNEANVLYSHIHGMPQLSIAAGLFVEALATQCGLSLEKMPTAIAYVLAMFLGELDETSVGRLIKASDTYSKARERVAKLTRNHNETVFNKPGVVLHMQMDDSHKGDVDLTCLPVTVRDNSESSPVVRGRALRPVQALTKKATSFARVSESVVDELTEVGACRVLGSTTDAFSAAQSTNRQFLGDLDGRAGGHFLDLQLASGVIPDLFYDLSAPIRELRAYLCHMHNYERMWTPMMVAPLGTPGLEHQSSTSQQYFSVNSSTGKLHGLTTTLLLHAVGGDVEELRHFARAAQCIVVKPSLTRWTTMGRAAAEMRSLQQVEAPQPLQDKVMDLCGGPDSSMWKELQRLAVCPGRPNVMSYIALVYAALAMTTPAQTAEICWVSLGFLCSPVHNIATEIGAELRTLELQSAAFANGKSRTHNATAISTRALEVVEADRRTVATLHALQTDWHAALPRGHSMLLVESERAVELGLCDDINEYRDLFDKRMSEGTKNVVALADTYLVQPYCRPGMCPLLLCCPATSRYCAAALLQYLYMDGFVHGPLLPPPDPSAAVYPHLTGGELQARLAEGLRDPAHRSAIYRAYALNHPVMVNELQALLTDPLNPPCTANNVPVILRDASDTALQNQWWEHLTIHYVSLADMLTQLFSGVAITSTAAEQYFSTATHICAKNAVVKTNMDSLHFFHTVKKIAGEYAEDKKTSTAPSLETTTHARPGRSLGDRVEQANGLHRFARELVKATPADEIPTVKDVRGTVGKKRAQIEENYDAWMEVMEENATKKPALVANGSVELVVRDVSTAKVEDTQGKIVLSLTPQQRAHKMTKAAIISELQGLGLNMASAQGRAISKMLKPALEQTLLEWWQNQQG
jgi:hypothetical protein